MSDIIRKPTKDEIEASPERYRILDGGAVYDMEQKKIVAHLGGPYQITAANSRAMVERRVAKGIHSRLRGMIRGAGLDIDEAATDEEIMSKAADALETYVAHMGRTFLKTENIRGMGEIFPKLVGPMLDRPDKEEIPYEQARGLLHDLADVARAALARHKEIKGKVIEIPESEYPLGSK